MVTLPSSSGYSQRCFCSSVPNTASTSDWPLPGVPGPVANTCGAHQERPMTSFNRARLTSPNPTPPCSGGRWAAYN